MHRKKLVVIGSINADHIMKVGDFPRPGETVIGEHYQIAFGGKGANQAVAAGRSGACVTFIARVGDDDIGQRILQQLEQDKVDIEAVESAAGVNTGVALIWVNRAGENQIAIAAGANGTLTENYLQKYQQKVIQADALLIQLETPLETVKQAVLLASQHQTKVILNPAPAQMLPDDLLSHVDIITPNETEAEILTGIPVTNESEAANAAAVLHNKGINIVIITLGSRGAWVSCQGKGKLVSGFKVNAVDTIAAGDTFNGALVTALLEGHELDLAIKFAHAAAALSVTRAGAQPSIPWRQEIDNFLLGKE